MIKRENHFRVDPRSYPRFSASMKLKFIIATLLIAVFLLPIVTQAALLPQPTGSCPERCAEGILGQCTGKEGEKPVQMICKLGKCVYSQGDIPTEFDLPCNYTLADIVQAGVNFVSLFMGIAGAMALLMFFYGGWQMVSSMGNPEAIEKGKKTLTGALIGLILVLGVVVFVQFGGGLLGASVKETGEVEVGKAECAGEEGTNPSDLYKCGGSEYMVCYKQACITDCDYKAQTDQSFYGHSCQTAFGGSWTKEWWECKGNINGVPSSVNVYSEADVKFTKETYNFICTKKTEKTAYCQTGYCPGGADYQCCISPARKKLIEEQNRAR